MDVVNREKMLMMTPGPTEVPARVLEAMAQPIQNPDIDEEFFEFYRTLEEKCKRIYNTEDDVIILGGEGILGLEASIASVIEKGEKILCISNGIFGKGFADFVEMYGGEAILVDFPYDKTIDLDIVKSTVEKHDFKACTMVHCETPTGVLNPLSDLLDLLGEKNIIRIVDAVSSLGGVPVPTDRIDICIGGSQKCFSSPPGLTTLSVSDKVWNEIMKGEKKSLYTSLGVWKETWFENDRLPYSHLVSNLYALKESFDMLLEEGIDNVYNRHEKAAQLCREKGKEIGFTLYPKEEKICSPTVTAFSVEESAVKIQTQIKEKEDILLGTGLGDMKDDILRVGHMGYNAKKDKVKKAMKALERHY